MLKSLCICTTFSRFNIFDDKNVKKVKNVKILDFFRTKNCHRLRR